MASPNTKKLESARVKLRARTIKTITPAKHEGNRRLRREAFIHNKLRSKVRQPERLKFLRSYNPYRVLTMLHLTGRSA